MTEKEFIQRYNQLSEQQKNQRDELLDQKYRNENLRSQLQDLEQLLKEKQKEAQRAYEIKTKAENNLKNMMEEHQVEIIKFKNDQLVQVKIVADLKNEIQQNELHNQKIIKKLNQEVNQLTEQSNSYLIKYKEANKQKKVSELKQREIEDQKEHLKLQLEQFKKLLKNMEQDFDGEIYKRNEIIKKLQMDYQKLDIAYQKLIEELKNQQEKFDKITSQLELKTKENNIITEDLNKLDQLYQTQKLHAIRETSVLKNEIEVLKSQLKLQGIQTKDKLSDLIKNDNPSKLIIQQLEETIKKLQESIDQKEKQLNSYMDELYDINKKNGDLKNNNEKLTIEIEKFYNENQKLRQENALKENEIGQTQKIMTDNSRRMTKMLKIKEVNQNQLNNKDQIIENFKILQNQLETEKKFLQEKINEQEEQNKDISQKNQSNLQKINEQEFEIRKLKNEIDFMQKDLDREKEILEQKIISLEQENNNVNVETIENLESKITLLLNEKNELQQKILDLEQKLNKSEEDKENYRDRYEQIREEFSIQKDELYKIQTLYKDLDQKYYRMLKSYSAIQVKVFVLFVELQRLKRKK